MVPKVVQDAGYTAVGLGVLAIQQVQTRRRETAARLAVQAQAAREQVESVVGQVKARVEPLTVPLDRLTRLPGPFGQVVGGGRDRLRQALRTGAEDQAPPVASKRAAAQAGTKTA